jgi:site-specific recombinase XerD
MLKAHRTAQKQDRLRAANVWTENGLVFPTETGQPCDPRSFLRVIETAANRAGIADVGVHTLRHSAATTLDRLAHEIRSRGLVGVERLARAVRVRRSDRLLHPYPLAERLRS